MRRVTPSAYGRADIWYHRVEFSGGEVDWIDCTSRESDRADDVENGLVGDEVNLMAPFSGGRATPSESGGADDAIGIGIGILFSA